MHTLSEQFDRLPPHDASAEMALLGSLAICDGERAIFSKVLQIIDRGMFYSSDNQIFFDGIASLFNSGKKIDAVSLRALLVSQGLFDEIGGHAYLGQVLNSVPSYAHASTYAEIVREKSQLRAVISLSNEAMRQAYSPNEPGAAEKILTDTAAKFARAAITGKAGQVHTLGEVVNEIVSRPSGTGGRILTGLTTVDRETGGMRLGGTMVVAGRPGMGKSVLLKQIGFKVASAGTCAGIISVEEDRHKVGENLLAAKSGVPNHRIAFNTLGAGERGALQQAAQQLQELPLYLVDSAFSLSAITSAANLLACEYDCRVIMVDHVHLIDGEVDRNTNREREISKISSGLKSLWKTLGVAGVEAAQLNRAAGRDRPTLTNLRDSGTLEQDADVVLLLHREDYYRRQEWTPGAPPPESDGLMEVQIAKNKDGATGVVTVAFDESTQRITDLPNAENPGLEDLS